MRRRVPLAAHAEFASTAGRPDPVALLQSQNDARITSLVPVRFGRMVASPFAFYRGAALVMANDLAGTPVTGWLAQGCGDAHLDNFGAFGTEQGSLVFDVNDFDEAYPAPWEWDVKRLAASAVLAAREIDAKRSSQRAAATAAVGEYRTAMRRLADMNVLSRWRSAVPATALMKRLGASPRKVDAATAEALQRTSAGALPKLTTLVGGSRVLKEKPPLVVRVSDERELARVHRGFDAYKRDLRRDLQVLLDSFEPTDFARKVVGVGSVGIPAYVGLLLSPDGEPLFLQVKMALRSVLEPHVAIADPFADPGERVVVGQRLMQAAGDPLLGAVATTEGHHYYVRQLRDMKVSADLSRMTAKRLSRYAGACGAVLAHAHARTGDPALIAGYLGNSPAFDTAVAEFAIRYADQTERDHATLQEAITAGRLAAETDL